MTSYSSTVACKHLDRRLLREVTVIVRKNKLSTGIRISGGKDYVLVDAKDPPTLRYNWLIHCDRCNEILQGERYVPQKN